MERLRKGPLFLQKNPKKTRAWKYEIYNHKELVSKAIASSN